MEVFWILQKHQIKIKKDSTKALNLDSTSGFNTAMPLSDGCDVLHIEPISNTDTTQELCADVLSGTFQLFLTRPYSKIPGGDVKDKNSLLLLL